MLSIRKGLVLTLASLLLGGLLVGATAAPVVATPVATNEELYRLYGRVFPDPHGCLAGAPATSPWAKGEVCAGQFVQWEEALGGLRFLEQRFPRFLQVLNLRTMFGDHPAFQGQEFQSAGLPQLDLSRDRRDLYIVKVTDRLSPVPEPDRRHFAYSLSIHGIERAGLEGGIRAIEDLVTWAACEGDAGAAPACAAEGPFPKPILEPTNSGPTAGEVLRNGVIYFVFSNPDGWHRGEVSEGGVFFQRYNGNGMDLNRDFPTIGYTEAQYTPSSEPETKGYTAFLDWVADHTTAGRFAGAIDLHGMVTAGSFSFTLLGAGQRDYRKNAITVDTSITTFRDSERRLSWSPLIAPAESCPVGYTPVGVLVTDAAAQMCSDQWGTVWDTINYQVTGSFGDWMDSPLGLDAIGINNEMALSHLAPNTVFDPQLEQLHIDGNKGLIYAQIASLLFEEPVEFRPTGKIGYVFDPARIQSPGGGTSDSPTNLPSQDDIERTEASGEGVSWEVRGVGDGVFNGGMTIEATCLNGQGIGACTGTGVVDVPMILDYCGPPEHVGEPGGCREIARYFNQSPTYSQAGARIDLNSPRPGPYRIRANPARVGPVRYEVSFSSGQAYDVPEQAPYDVSRMDFFTDLNKFVPVGSELQPISVQTVLKKPKTLNAFDSIVAAADLMPGFLPADEFRPAEPAGTPQGQQTFAFENGSLPLASTPTFEWNVEPGFDNDQMIVEASWGTPSDYDLRVDYLNPATSQWEERGCPCEFVNQGESLTVFAPETGRWRVRLENFAALPQRVEGRVSFVALPSPGTGSQSQYSAREFDRYAGRLAQWTAGGGNLVLTDGAMASLPYVGGALPADAVGDGVFYAGWMDFDDGRGPTYDRHPLARGVNKEGTAEGRGSVDGHSFDNRHQTYEPVPLGYYVSESGSSNAGCDTDRCDSPNWIVDQAAWEAAGGTTAARTLVRQTVTPGSSTEVGVSLGELPLGSGRIRIAGALLPDPTEQNYHPFGLTSYALTYTGYQVFENLVEYRRG